MSEKEKHIDLPETSVRKLFDLTVEHLMDMFDNILTDATMINQKEAKQVMTLVKTRMVSNPQLEKIYAREFETIRSAFHQLELQKKRKDFFGRLLIFPVEDKISDSMITGGIYRKLIPDYVKSLKSMLGINYVETKQREAQLLIDRFRIDDKIDWSKVYSDTRVQRMVYEIADQLRLRFKEPRAIQFLIQRMNRGVFYAKSKSKYGVEDLNVFLRFLFRTIRAYEKEHGKK